MHIQYRGRRSFLQHGQQAVLRQNTAPYEVEPIGYLQIGALEAKTGAWCA